MIELIKIPNGSMLGKFHDCSFLTYSYGDCTTWMFSTEKCYQPTITRTSVASLLSLRLYVLFPAYHDCKRGKKKKQSYLIRESFPPPCISAVYLSLCMFV